MDKPALFEVADEGTIFLDEIADASPAVQAKLLRAVEEGAIRRVGDTQTRKIDVRVISATSRELSEHVQSGAIREDLFYRLDVVQLYLPPLRDRMGDIPLLADHFLRNICDRDGKSIPGFTQGALSLLCVYPWPGNVRELQNEVERCAAMAASDEAIGAAMVSPAIRDIGGGVSEVAQTGGKLQDMLEHIERLVIEQALQRCEGNITLTARELGMSRSGMYNKIRRYKLKV